MSLVRLVAVIVAACLFGACAGATPGASGAAPLAAAGDLRVLTPSNGDVVTTASVTFAGTAPQGATVVQDVSHVARSAGRGHRRDLDARRGP